MKAHCMLWEPHLAQKEVWQIACALHHSTGTPLMWHQHGYVAQTGPGWIWSMNESNVCYCLFLFLWNASRNCFMSRFYTLTNQLLRTDRGHTIKVALAPEPPPPPDGTLPVPTSHTDWFPVKLSHTVMNKLKKWSMLYPPEPFFALFFAGPIWEEVHSRAEAKSTSSSRTTPGNERTRTLAETEGISNTKESLPFSLPENKNRK